MKTVMKKTIMLCLAALTATGAYAQVQLVTTGASTHAPQGQTIELDLDTAIQIALDDNPTIKVAGLEIERQKLVKKETWGNFLPSISVDGTYSRAIKKSGGMAGLMSADNTVSVAGSVGLPLYVPALFQTLKLNDEQMRAAVESARGSKLTLVNEVKKAYYQILLAEESLTVLRSSEENISQTVKDTRTKFENEMASEYDLITAEVQLSNLQPTIFEVENGIGVAKKMMKMLLNIPEDVEIALSGDLDSMTAENNNTTFTRSIDNNNDLRLLEIQSDMLGRQLKLQRTSRMPSLSAFGSVSPTGMEQVDFEKYMGSGQMATNFEWNTPISVGVRLSIPLFAGRTNIMKERQIKNNMRQLDIQKDYFENSLNVQIDNAINAVNTANAKMLANKKTIEQAERGYNIMKVRYDAGMGTILELNSSELQMTSARLNYTQAVYDYLSALADYEKLIGKEN